MKKIYTFLLIAAIAISCAPIEDNGVLLDFRPVAPWIPERNYDDDFGVHIEIGVDNCRNVYMRDNGTTYNWDDNKIQSTEWVWYVQDGRYYSQYDSEAEKIIEKIAENISTLRKYKGDNEIVVKTLSPFEVYTLFVVGVTPDNLLLGWHCECMSRCDFEIPLWDCEINYDKYNDLINIKTKQPVSSDSFIILAKGSDFKNREGLYKSDLEEIGDTYKLEPSGDGFRFSTKDCRPGKYIAIVYTRYNGYIDKADYSGILTIE